MAKVLVTGATGLLGSTLIPRLQERGHHVWRMGRSQVTDLNADLTSYAQTAHVLNQVKPEVIINLAALTNVDRCETQPHEAYRLNVKPVENLCIWMRAVGHPCHLIQISSDQLYDGVGPHAEGELTIRNHYAMSKLAAEFVAATVPSTTLRTNFVGRSQCEGRLSFTDWLYGALLGTGPITVFDDVMFSPLYLGTLCDYIELTVVKRPLGVFNLGSSNGSSKADFAFAFAAVTGLPTTNLVRGKVSTGDKLIAPRPKDMRMRCELFERRMGLKIPSLIDEIQRLAHDYP